MAATAMFVVGATAAAAPAPRTLMPARSHSQQHGPVSNTTAGAYTCSNNGPPPGSSYTCAQQKSWGKCSEPWMQGYCCSTCNGGGGTCSNNGPPPGSSYTCAQQKAWGKCSEPWMKGYCCSTCNGGGGGGGNNLAALLADCGCGNCHGCGVEGPNSVRRTMEAEFNSACNSLGCTSQERAVMLAMAMQESNDMDSTDTSKGHSSGSSNFSPFNLNADELSHLGCDMGCAQSLGQYSTDYNIPKAVGFVIQGLRGSALGGACDFLNYHRDGSSGWDACKGKGCTCDCGWGGCKAYKDAIRDAAEQVLSNPSYGTAGYRVCEKVPHI